MKKNHALRIIFGLMIVLVISVSGCQITDQKSSKKEVKIEEKTWDLLWVTDSSGWGVARIFGEYIAKDNGVEVNVLDKWKGGLSAGRILNALTAQDDPEYDMARLREYIENSEIIVIYGNPEDSKDPSNPWKWNCGQNEVEKCYVNSCDMDTFETYIANLKEIYSIIFELRKGKPTIIRSIDAYNPRLVNQCAPDGSFEECKTCWENYNKAIHQAADEMGVKVAGVFDTWNGLDHTENPVEKGFTQEDKIHPNEKGATVIAQLLRDLKYDPIIP